MREVKGGGKLLLRLTFGAVVADPSGVALTGAVDGITGAVVGAQTGLGAGFTELSTGTHCGHAHTHTHTQHVQHC